jgi:hypothetical protein
MPTRSIGKKIALGFFVVSSICMIISVGLCVWLLSTKGVMDVLTVSALATCLFFASLAVTLYWVSKPPQHELLPWDAHDP